MFPPVLSWAANWFAGFVAPAHADHAHPTDPRRQHDAHVDVHARRVAREMRRDCRVVPRPVVGMERKLRDDLGAAAPLAIGRKAAQLVVARRRVVLVGLDVPVPVAFAGRLHGERVALLRQAQRLLSLLEQGPYARFKVQDLG